MFRILIIILILGVLPDWVSAQEEGWEPSAAIEPEAVEVIMPSGEKTYRKNTRRSSQEAANGGQKVYILNNQAQEYDADPYYGVQNQPTTVIEAAPLTQSRASGLRRSREQMELETEGKIVEKLEQSRIEDERERAERLFGDRWEKEKPAPAPQQPIYQPVVIAPTPVDEPEKEVIHSEVRTDYEDENWGENSTYAFANLGVVNYPDAVNIRGNLAAGFGLGVVLPNRFVVEGLFNYSNFELDVDPADYTSNTVEDGLYLVKDVDQYNIAVATKFRVLPARFTPVIGAMIGYTHRSYSDLYQVSANTSTTSSNAFDVGFSLGADLKVTEGFHLGADFSYWRNLTYRQNTEYPQRPIQRFADTIPVEEFNYYFLGINGKFVF